jgi:nitroimidazol reductase NimA-like FMN-containing flavoprotein (pyridoxamine 5'-phosphate oxidase superfamily)
MTDASSLPDPGQSPADAARSIIESNAYMTLATADASGLPWATPVWFAHAAVDGDEFIWISRPGARHSQNIAARPEVAIAIYDSTVPEGEAAAVYVEAVAAEVADDERAAALAVFNERSEARGLRPWQGSDVTGFAPHRLYRATATAEFVLGESDERVPVGGD